MATANTPKFQRVKSVTLPILKLVKNETRYLVFLGPIHQGEKMKNAKAEDKVADLCHALDMETGEEGQIIVPAVLKAEIERNYEGESYVSRGFELTVTRDTEKRYNMVSIAEVAVPDDIAETAAKLVAQRKGEGDRQATQAAAKTGKPAK